MQGLKIMLISAILSSTSLADMRTTQPSKDGDTDHHGFILTIGGDTGARFEATCHVTLPSGKEEHFIVGSAPLVQTLPGTGIECSVRVLSPGGSLMVGLQRKAGGAIMKSQVTGVGSQIVLRHNG